MKLITQAAARKLLKSNPFLRKIKYCTGKYDWEKRTEFLARDHEVGPQVHSIWLERRQDRHGPYALFMCAVTY